MIRLNKIHHVAVICSDYQNSKKFYTEILRLSIINETFRASRQSYKLDLALDGNFILELFSMPYAPERLTRPEATGLRHLAFEVNDLKETIEYFSTKNIFVEPVRIDEITGKRFTFIFDPDELPIEFYEA